MIRKRLSRFAWKPQKKRRQDWKKRVVAKKMKSFKEFPPARGSSLSVNQVFERIQYAKPGQ